MLKKFIITALLLLILHGTVFGASPSATDIFNQMYLLQPGTDVKAAYDLLGPPQETNDTPPILLWNIAPNRVILVFLRNSSIIEKIGYIETYEQISFASMRYEELKKGFYKIIKSPAKEAEWGSGWFINNSIFAVDYSEESFGSNVTVYFFEINE